MKIASKLGKIKRIVPNYKLLGDLVELSAIVEPRLAKIATLMHIRRVMDASTLEEAVASIKDTLVGEYLSAHKGRPVSELLWEHLSSELREIITTAPPGVKEFLEKWATRWDVPAITATPLLISQGKRVTEEIVAPIGLLRWTGLHRSLELAKTVEDVEAIASSLGLTAGLRACRAYYETLLREAAKLHYKDDREAITEVLRIEADIIAISCALRAPKVEVVVDNLPLGFISEDAIIKATRASTLKEKLDALRDTPYYKLLSGKTSIIDCEHSLRQYLIDVVRTRLGLLLFRTATALNYFYLKEAERLNLELAFAAMEGRISKAVAERFLLKY